MDSEKVQLEVEFDPVSAAKAGEEAARKADQQSRKAQSNVTPGGARKLPPSVMPADDPTGSKAREASFKLREKLQREGKSNEEINSMMRAAKAAAQKAAERLNIAPSGSGAGAQPGSTVGDGVGPSPRRRRRQPEGDPKPGGPMPPEGPQPPSLKDALRRQTREQKQGEQDARRQEANRLKSERAEERRYKPFSERLGNYLGGRDPMTGSMDPRKNNGIAGLLGMRGRGAQMLGRAAGPAAGIAGLVGMGKAAGATVGSAITGNTSGMIQGGTQMVQSLGTALMALGPAGMIAGVAIKTLGAVAGKTAEMLDGLVDALAQYSGVASQALAELEVKTELFKMRMSKQTEGLQSAWLKFKGSLLDLVEKAAPLLDFFIEKLTELLDFMNRWNQAVGKITEAVFGKADEKKKKEEDPSDFSAMNRRMLEDLNINAALPAPVAPGDGGSIDIPSAPQYRAPGGGGVSLAVQQTYHQHIEDFSAVDRAVEQIRDRLTNCLQQFGDRVDLLAGQMDMRNSAALSI